MRRIGFVLYAESHVELVVVGLTEPESRATINAFTMMYCDDSRDRICAIVAWQRSIGKFRASLRIRRDRTSFIANYLFAILLASQMSELVRSLAGTIWPVLRADQAVRIGYFARC